MEKDKFISSKDPYKISLTFREEWQGTLSPEIKSERQEKIDKQKSL